MKNANHEWARGLPVKDKMIPLNVVHFKETSLPFLTSFHEVRCYKWDGLLARTLLLDVTGVFWEGRHI